MLWDVRSIEDDTSHVEIGIRQSTSFLYLLVPTMSARRVLGWLWELGVCHRTKSETRHVYRYRTPPTTVSRPVFTLLKCERGPAFMALNAQVSIMFVLQRYNHSEDFFDHWTTLCNKKLHIAGLRVIIYHCHLSSMHLPSSRHTHTSIYKVR